MPEWSKGDDLSSSIERCVGSNPTSSNLLQLVRAICFSWSEHMAVNRVVTGSIPV